LENTISLSINQDCRLFKDRKKTNRFRKRTGGSIFFRDKNVAILKIKPCTAPAINRKLKMAVMFIGEHGVIKY